MKASYIYKNHYNEMTEKSKKVVEQSDQFLDKEVGDFDSVKAFNDFVEENYRDKDLD